MCSGGRNGMHRSSRRSVLCHRGNDTTHLTTTSVKVLTNRQGTCMASICRGGSKRPEQPIRRRRTGHTWNSTRHTSVNTHTSISVNMTRSSVMQGSVQLGMCRTGLRGLSDWQSR